MWGTLQTEGLIRLTLMAACPHAAPAIMTLQVTSRKLAIICGLALGGVAVFVCIRHSDLAQLQTGRGLEAPLAPHSAVAPKSLNAPPNAPQPVAPFIMTDTATDSPGTNLDRKSTRLNSSHL